MEAAGGGDLGGRGAAEEPGGASDQHQGGDATDRASLYGRRGGHPEIQDLRKTNGHLGLVPRQRSAWAYQPGSRNLTRTILTQCVHHVAASSVCLERCYQVLRDKRGTRRARIAVIRKLCGIMRRMLLSREPYGSIDSSLYVRKLKQHKRALR